MTTNTMTMTVTIITASLFDATPSDAVFSNVVCFLLIELFVSTMLRYIQATNGCSLKFCGPDVAMLPSSRMYLRGFGEYAIRTLLGVFYAVWEDSSWRSLCIPSLLRVFRLLTLVLCCQTGKR